MTRPLLPVGDANLAVALPADDRPPASGAVSASLTFGWRALLKIKHVPEQSGTAVHEAAFGGDEDAAPIGLVLLVSTVLVVVFAPLTMRRYGNKQ